MQPSCNFSATVSKDGRKMTTRGIEAEVQALLAAEGPETDPASSGQMDLAIFDDMPSPIAAAMADRGVAPRGVGQRGKSKKTLDLVQLIKATKRPTLLALKELADLPLPDFARLLGCSLLEAYDRWFRLAELCAAYEEGRPTQRVALDAGGPGLPVVVFANVPVDPRLAGGNPPEAIDAEFEEVEGNQGVDDPAADEVARLKSHDLHQGLAPQGVAPVPPAD